MAAKAVEAARVVEASGVVRAVSVARAETAANVVGAARAVRGAHEPGQRRNRRLIHFFMKCHAPAANPRTVAGLKAIKPMRSRRCDIQSFL